ncbi:uncharacterized protein LOC118226818 [Anguilla anguilla]|uniref:DUF4371 domain-containing protein n=1 Tax=Anguilla anguilla TaxID=7936 RepID=A0A9D3MIK9_ANGAN|nr:uncharacterized protein LOC118226818 [Anguilla anguilla]KAG5848676.1 hypothetical protein ANANG_G00101350 [Anguilla anguilla]
MPIILLFRQMRQLIFPPTASWCLCYGTSTFITTSKSTFSSSSLIRMQPLTQSPQRCWRSTILPEGQESRLIAQAYDGAAMMRGATGGAQRKVKDVYGSAHYGHCYVHQLNLIMQQATSHIPRISTFFSDLGEFAAFFSRSFNRITVLDQVVADFPELRQQGGTSTVVLLTLCMSTMMTSYGVSRLSETQGHSFSAWGIQWICAAAAHKETRTRRTTAVGYRGM